MAVVEALKKTKGATDTEKLIAAMEGMSFDTPKGKMTFRKEDHQAMQSMYHFKIKVDPAFSWGMPELVSEIKPEEMTVPIETSDDAVDQGLPRPVRSGPPVPCERGFQWGEPELVHLRKIGRDLPLRLLRTAAAWARLGAFEPAAAEHRPDAATVSGLSSGGFMAVQLHVAHSATLVKGAGIVAGGPYYCAEGSIVSRPADAWPVRPGSRPPAW